MSVVETDEYENEFSDFLIQRIQSLGGSIKFQHISGYLSQVRLEVRKHIGTSFLDIKNFLKRHPNLFMIKNDIVSLVDSLEESSDYYDQNSLPQKIRKGKGVIVKLTETFGFLNAKDPIKTTVYFRAIHFGDENVDLTNFGLNIGTMVYFDAVFHKRLPNEHGNNFTSKYNATKVWKINKTDENCEPVIPKSRKNRELGLYDPLIISGDGIIQNIFTNLGFIAADGDDKNTVFFHKNRVVNINNIVDLTKVFERGEIVEFNAHRSTKPDSKARWEATKVWKKSGKMLSSKNFVPFESSNQEDKSCSQSSYSGSSRKEVHSAVNKYLNNNNPREVIKNQRGKICPRAEGAVIKFGEKDSQLADGDSSKYFEKGKKVDDVSWVFSEDDEVWFDAVKIKSAPGWKAILVWRGDKPDIDLSLEGIGDFVYNTDEELEEIPETFSYTSKSSCLSESSYTSVQSENTKSESLHSARSNIRSKWNSMKLNEIPDKVPNKQSFNSRNCSSFTSSQNSLCSSTESKQVEKLRKNFKDNQNNSEYNPKYTPSLNWADCPYPEEDYQSELPKHNISNYDATEEFFSSITDNKDNEIELFEKYLETPEKKSQLREEFIEDHKISLSNSAENAVNEVKDDVDLKHVDNVENKASIKKFQNLTGKIVKVYSKFAEVKSPNLKKPLAFFWNTLYHNGRSVDDLQLNDLKEVIKVDDNINFNYFEITDDSSQLWQKVTVAWTGCKPKRYTEISPSEFIKQNNLSVHVEPETILENSYEVKNTAKKFLTVVSDSISNCDVEESMLVTPDIEKSGSVASDAEKSVSVTREIEESVLATRSSFEREVFFGHASKQNEQSGEDADFETLTNLVGQMLLTKKLFMTNSKIDMKILSRDIINLVLQYHDAEESDRSLQIFLPKEENKKSDLICSVCRKCISEECSNVNTEDTEIQTIITGDIIAQNIFTEC